MAGRGLLAVPLVVLASGSPRRAAILRQLGIEPDIRPVDVDEAVVAGESASDLVERLATAKLEACARLLAPSPRSILMIAADTVVEIGGSILGKPTGEVDADRMLTMLSGRDHHVVTGVAVGLIDPAEADVDGNGPLRVASARETTEVSFRVLDRDLIDWYIGTGEAFDKAGSYAVQGRGALLVDRVDGSYLNVVGLPVVALDDLCRRLGWPLHRLAGAHHVGVGREAEAGIGT